MIDQQFMLFIFNDKCTWRFRHLFSYKISSLRVKNLQVMNNLKVYDPDPERRFTEAKSARQSITEVNGETASDANQFKNFPTFGSAFGNFTFLSTFVPTDKLENLKYCGKYSRKSTDAVPKFSISKGLRTLSFFVDDVIYLRTLYWASYSLG